MTPALHRHVHVTPRQERQTSAQRFGVCLPRVMACSAEANRDSPRTTPHCRQRKAAAAAGGRGATKEDKAGGTAPLEVSLIFNILALGDSTHHQKERGPQGSAPPPPPRRGAPFFGLLRTQIGSLAVMVGGVRAWWGAEYARGERRKEMRCAHRGPCDFHSVEESARARELPFTCEEEGVRGMKSGGESTRGNSEGGERHGWANGYQRQRGNKIARGRRGVSWEYEETAGRTMPRIR
ncbi:hypothetical protein EDB86DRAFT_3240205 [Lactarius hatsudake]|nr:hypothetical protein EDB86DRAFT_3240205 [Lactarius hatsudake]